MLQLWKVTNFLVRFFVFETVVTASGGGKDQIYIYICIEISIYVCGFKHTCIQCILYILVYGFNVKTYRNACIYIYIQDCKFNKSSHIIWVVYPYPQLEV